MFRSVFDMFTGVVGPLLMSLAAAIILGFFTSATYRFIRRRNSLTRGFTITLAVLPAIVSVLVAVVNIRSVELSSSGLQVGLVLAGIFAITRFRSDPLTAEDLMYIVLSFFIGVGNGLGYVGYTVIGTVAAIVMLLIIDATNFGAQSIRDKRLRFIVPEDLNYEEEFVNVLSKYCEYATLERVKTTDFGQLFELTYNVKMKKKVSEKALIDEIRGKNANLEVTLTSRQQP
ncbi:MAG TPA: DUF4956 domain-containing protein [Bacilli bacterium]|nr:DUF4956 domain-containing protein [Bacilli bacterium]